MVFLVADCLWEDIFGESPVFLISILKPPKLYPATRCLMSTTIHHTLQNIVTLYRKCRSLLTPSSAVSV